MASGTMRVYDEDGIRYTYITNASSMDDRFCRIKYPDNTTQIMYDKSRIIKHIYFHKKHVYYGYAMDPPFDYKSNYVGYFDQFRKNKLYSQSEYNEDMLKISNILNTQSIKKHNKLNISNILN